ncbi:GntR family transcriptional regulator [Georgenia sp. AZ-5]|uniref:GntR family transcriptional regulator n=1 Tax=Georgenia sp. AZ-5 TaxID=3367526 RepID=UPI0037544AF1
MDALEESLRSDIFNGKIPAGEKLKESPLAQQLEVSRHTLRAALTRLENVGLLQYRENRGWSVPVFGREEYADILLLRESLEASAYRVALAEGTKPGVEVARALDRIVSMTEDDSWALRIDADCNLHQTLVDMAHSPRLSRAFADMLDEFRLCRLQSIDWLEQLPLDEWKAKHVALVEGLRAADLEAIALVSDHFTSDPWKSPRHKTASVTGRA